MGAEQLRVGVDEPAGRNTADAFGLAAHLAGLLPRQLETDADAGRDQFQGRHRLPVRDRQQGIAIDAVAPQQFAPVETVQTAGDAIGGGGDVGLDIAVNLEQHPARCAGKAKEHDADEAQNEMDEQPHELVPSRLLCRI